MIDAAAHNLRLHPTARARGAVGRRGAVEGVALNVTAIAVALVPLAVPQGPGNTAPIDLLLTVAVATCLLWATTVGFRCRFPYVIPVMLALVGGAVGGLLGSVPTMGIVALLQDIVLIAWCWAIANIAHSAANLRLLLSTWVYGAIGWAVIAFIGLATGNTLLTGQIERQGTRLQLTLADPSYTANYFFISIMIMWATRRPRHRVVRLATYGLLLAAIAATGSNSGIVAVVVGTVIATIVGTYRRFGGAPAVAASAFILLAGFGLASTVSLANIQAKAHDSRYAFVRQGIGRSTDSAGQRESLLTESLRLYRTGNPLGEGPVSTKPRLKREQAPLIKEAHDDYLAALIERGPIGLVGILLLVASLGVRGLQVAKGPLGPGFAAVVARPNALVGAVGGTLVASTVYELLHVRHIWALFALVAALSIWGRD